MAIQIGQRLGPYEILSAIGAGGMGEVYRAHDARLNRNIALKVLPEIFATDPDRMARFEREARVLGVLNHPNIAAIYGLEEFGSGRALVMELVEGPTLADRIAVGLIPVDEALPIAKQVAEALEYAHDHGVIHRDLKPANIKVTTEGTVKVLDFGLAKALMDEPAAADPRDFPTLSMAPTLTGVILGTAAYMSPEQAKGKPVDRRTDIWAFGVVLFEMLAGKPLFSGETGAETLASVIKEEPDLGALPKNTPSAIRHLLHRCLERSLRRRVQHIGEARIVIEDVLSGTAATAEPLVIKHKSRERLAWSVSAALLIGLVAALALVAIEYFHPRMDQRTAAHFLVSLPDKWSLPMLTSGGGSVAPLALSPDGRRIAFVATNKEQSSVLWVRPLDTVTPQTLSGTEGATSPFWSPDGQFLGFFAEGKLKKIAVSGGPAVTLCDALSGRGGTWNRNGVIIFAPTGASGLQAVSASGGVAKPVTTLAKGEISNVWPWFLPDGRHFLYRANTGSLTGPVYLASLDTPERKFLLSIDSGNIVYTQGHLLFLRERNLVAQPFDARHLALTGDAFPVADQIQASQTANPNGVFSASENGILAFQTALTAAGSQLVWFDRAGKQISVLGDSAAYGDLELSPDGKRASVSIPDQVGKGRDIWLYDVTRGIRTRFTFDPADEQTSTWSADGSRVVFNSRRKGHLDLYQKLSSGAGTEELLLEDDQDKYPLGWSSDGRVFLYAAGGPTGFDLFVLPLLDRKPYPFLQSQFSKTFSQLSPDGRWVAYQSAESGRFEIYVAPFPGPGGKWQLSTAGGQMPRWRRDGSEVFYLDPSKRLMAAAVMGSDSSFDVGAVKPLFETRALIGLRFSYAVTADGQRFLINTIPEQTASAPITVVLNWAAGLKK